MFPELLHERLGDTGNEADQGEDDTYNTPESEEVNNTLSGEYRSNRGAELWFNEDGSVLVSESGGHTRCSYTLDAEGNLTIYASSETLEEKYNAEQDYVTLYGINYYRD